MHRSRSCSPEQRVFAGDRKEGFWVVGTTAIIWDKQGSFVQQMLKEWVVHSTALVWFMHFELKCGRPDMGDQ